MDDAAPRLTSFGVAYLDFGCRRRGRTTKKAIGLSGAKNLSQKYPAKTLGMTSVFAIVPSQKTRSPGASNRMKTDPKVYNERLRDLLIGKTVTTIRFVEGELFLELEPYTRVFIDRINVEQISITSDEE